MASVFFRRHMLPQQCDYLGRRVVVAHLRQYSDNPPPSDVKPSKKYSREQVKKDVEGYVFTRYIGIVKNYDKVLEKNFPSAMRIYRVFLDGVAAFYKDMKRYIKIKGILNNSSRGFFCLTRNELELFYQMPRDMYKVAPVILFSSLPLVGYAALPLTMLYPRALLSSHFWTIQQKSEFQQLYMIERLSNNRNVFRCLQSKLEKLKDTAFYEPFNQVIAQLGSGQHPSIDQILSLKDLFACSPYQFSSLTQSHIKYLCHIHGLRAGIFALFGRQRLLERAELMHHMDLAIKREGGVHNMPPEALKHSCYIRGLNPMNLSNEALIEWLRSWLQVSLQLEEQHNSLFLHLPILLGYNHPNNWRLIYK